MLNFFKFIEIIISLQSIFISSMIPVFINIAFIKDYKFFFELPITWQIPTIILLSIIFGSRIVIKAFSIYLIIGLFLIPIFHQGGSLGYLLTPNFGYLIGIFPLIKIINKLYLIDKINYLNTLCTAILAILIMHLIGISYIFIQLLYYRQIDTFLYNIAYYSLGKIGYHILMIIPLLLLIKPIKYLRKRN